MLQGGVARPPRPGVTGRLAETPVRPRPSSVAGVTWAFGTTGRRLPARQVMAVAGPRLARPPRLDSPYLEQDGLNLVLFLLTVKYTNRYG